MDLQDFEARRRLVETPYGRVAVYETGEGPPALFVHGFPLSAYHWRHQLEGLADLRRCVAVDLLGLGYTEAARGVRIDYPTQARMLAALVETLDLGPVDLVGNDSGGSIAQLFAVEDPQRVRTLTLTNCEVAENNPPPPLVPVVELARAGKFADMLESIAGSAEAAQGALAAVFARPAEVLTAERVAYDVGPLVATSERRRQAEEYLCTLSADVTVDAARKLEAFDRPVLVVWGDADPYMPITWAHWLKEHVPGVRKVALVPGGKLFFPEEEARLLNAELRAFWSKQVGD